MKQAPTPETDELRDKYRDKATTLAWTTLLAFARKLERQRNKLRAEIKPLKARVDSFERLASMIKNYPKTKTRAKSRVWPNKTS